MEIFGYLQRKKDELRIYRPPTTNLAEIQKREEQDDIFQFLASLDSTYEAVRSQILLLAELPSSDEVAAMVQREETRRTVMGSQPLTQSLENIESKGLAAMARHNSNPRSEVRGDQAIEKCEHCRREGHRGEACWFLYPHLRPKWHKKGGDRSRGSHGGFERKKSHLADSREEETGKGAGTERVGPNPGSNEPKCEPDQMQQLLKQLIVLLNQKQENKKTSGSDNQEYDW